MRVCACEFMRASVRVRMCECKCECECMRANVWERVCECECECVGANV